MAEEIGVGYVRLVPSMRGFAKAAKRELESALSGPASDAGDEAGNEIAKGGKPAGGKFARGFESGVDINWGKIGGSNDSGDTSSGFGRDFAIDFSFGAEKEGKSKAPGLARKMVHWFGNAFGVAAKPTAATLATAFSAQFVGGLISAMASGIAKLAHGLGAVAALLPAAAGAGILAFGTLKVAVMGVGEALEAGLAGDTAAFDEAIKNLSPSAKTFARSIAGMKDQLDDLKETVQENFFAQFAEQTKKLGSTYLPVLKTAMGGVATSMGQAVRETAGFLTLPKTSGAISTALGHMGKAIGNVTSALAPMVRAFLPLVTVGATFLPRLTGGLEGAANRLADFMEHARDTGKLASFIQGGLDKLRELWETTKQLGRILTDVLGIIRKVFGAGGATGGGGLLDAIESGVDSFNRFLESARGASVLGDVMRTLGSIISNTMGTLQRVGETLGRVFGPIMPDILNFIEALSRLKAVVVNTALDALEPILMALGAVLGGVVLPALTKLADWLADNQSVLQAIGIAIMTLLVPAFYAWAIAAAQAAIATTLAWLPIVLIGAAIAALAYLIIRNWDTIKKATAAVVNFIKDHWQGLLQILAGPIGLAVALITRHWQTIKKAVGAVVGWIGDHWQGLLQILTGPIGLAVAVLTRHWETIKNAVGAVLGWIKEHWGLLLAILSLPLAIFVALVVTQWEHIRAFITTILGAIATAVTTVFGFLAAVISAAFRTAAAVITTVFVTIAAVAMVIFNAIKGVVLAVFAAITAAVRAGGNVIMAIWRAVRGVAVAVWQAIWSKTASVRDAIAGAVTWLKGHIVGVFNSVKEGVSNAWEGMKGAISAVVEWIAGKVEAVMGMIGDIGNAISNIPGAGVVKDAAGFLGIGDADGGIVPQYLASGGVGGPRGTDTIPAWLTPGEMVLTKAQQGQLWAIANGALNSTGVAPAPAAQARVVIDVTGGPPEMVQMIKKMIRTDGHGDPVAYLSP